MIKESVFLFLLIDVGNHYEQKYIGKLSNCLDAQ